MDQISGLPKAILHEILSWLPRRDCVRTSVLSKAWRETWSIFPILFICDEQLMGRTNKADEDFSRKRKIFLDYVKKTLLRFREQGLPINEFKLVLNNNYDQRPMFPDIDLWMKLAIESRVEVLKLCRMLGGSGQSVDQWYTFPPGVLEAKSLIELELLREVRIERIVLNHSIQDFSLRVLSLCNVLLGDEGIIEHLISRCPLIEQITLKFCHIYDPCVSDPPHIEGLTVLRTFQLKSLGTNGLKRLKGVEIGGIHEVYIDAPNLENLCYIPEKISFSSLDNGFSSPFKLNIDNCINLRRLELLYSKKTVIADDWLLELFSNLPLLESLKLKSCHMSERINISSAQLKVLELSYCSNFKEVNIGAPNLLSCGFCDWAGNIPVVSFLSSSSKLEVKVAIHFSSLNLYKLREVIQNFKTHKVLTLLSLFIFGLDNIKSKPDGLQVSSHLPFVKQLHLGAVPSGEAMYLPLVNLLLSTCCPETISFRLHSHFWCEAFVEFLFEMLKGRNRDKCYCSSGHTKCWWHGLKNVTRSVMTINSETLLGETTTLPTMEIMSFRLEL